MIILLALSILLTGLFASLKATGVIRWSWLAVTLPLVVGASLWLGGLLFFWALIHAAPIM